MTTRKIQLTEGNVRHAHTYLGTVRDIFPADAIGESNRRTAGVPITFVFEPGDTIETDIAGDKMILRNRAAVRTFMKLAQLTAGDAVEIAADGGRTFYVRRSTAPRRSGAEGRCG